MGIGRLLGEWMRHLLTFMAEHPGKAR